MNWDLRQCITERDKIELHFQDGRRKAVSPVGIQIYGNQIYLFAFDLSEKLLTVPINDIASFKMKNEKYGLELAEKFHSIPWEQLREKIEKERNTKNEED